MDASDFMTKRVTAAELGDSAPFQVALFYGLHVASGHILLPILLAIFILSPKVNRHPTLLNLIISFIFSSISACLLLYAGKTIGPQPSKTLCVLQAGFINSITPMWATASLVLVYNIWNTFSRATRKLQGPDSAYKRVLMLAAPYLMWAIWSTAGLYVSFSHADKVSRDHRVFYCSVDYVPFPAAMSAITSVICVIITGFQIHLGIILYRNYRAVGDGGIDVKFVTRTLIFGVYTLGGMFISLVTFFWPQNSFSDMFAASFGLAVFVIFGTQADVLAAVKFWKKKESTPSVPWTPVVAGLSGDRDEKASMRSFQLDVKKGDAVSVISTPSEAFVRQSRV